MKKIVTRTICLILCLMIVASTGSMAFAGTIPAKASLVSVATKNVGNENVLSIKWNEIKCSGYQLSIAKDETFKGEKLNQIPGSSRVSVTVMTSLAGGSVRVRAYNTESGQKNFGQWSDPLKFGLISQPVKPTEPAKPTEPEKNLTKAERQAKARQGAVDWAIKIAKDNSFHYGQQKWAHHNGCYFCGTNQKKGSIKRKYGASVKQCEKTYCCNPFVTAAFKHGAGAKEVDCKVSGKRINLANDSNPALNNKNAFKKISKPKKLTSLEAGDVLITPRHAMLYVGNGKVAEAAMADYGKKGDRWNKSIRVVSLSSGRWKGVTKTYR